MTTASVTSDRVRLRAPRPADRPRLREIVEATGVFRPDEIPIALEVFDDGVAAPAKDYWSVAAVAGDRLLGWAAFGPTPCTLGTWDLYWIVVDPVQHGQGIGRRLMAHCEAAIQAAGGRLVVVETSSRAGYAPTRRFYEGLGYDAQATIRGYYAPGDDLVVYVKTLGSSRTSR